MKAHLLFSLLVLPILLGIDNKDRKLEDANRYVVIQIKSEDPNSDFLFEGAYLSRWGKRSTLEFIDAKAPYEFRLENGVGVALLRGKSGKGKIYFKYKTSREEKESMQYSEKEEVVIVSFRPRPDTTMCWLSGSMFEWSSSASGRIPSSPEDFKLLNEFIDPELKVTAFTNF